MIATNKREIVFIDQGVDDLGTLLDGIRSDVEPLLLSSDEPAVRQMARAVRGRKGLQAVHIIAHGQPGEVAFSAGRLSLDTIDRDAGELAVLGGAIGQGGELLIWSCAVARGERGAAFVSAIADATGAKVAASERRIGAAAHGGSWELAPIGIIGSGRPPITAVGRRTYAGVLDTSNTTISGNNSTNTLNVTGSNDKISDGNGTNSVAVTGNNNTISDGNGTNTVTVAGSNNTVSDGNGTNTITVTGNNNTISDGNGSNAIIASGSNATISDGNGGNLIYAAGTSGTNSISDGNGTNVIVGGSGADTITSGNGTNIIYGGAGNDTIKVGNGGDVIMAGAGSDTVTAGNGNDLFIYALSDHYTVVSSGTTATLHSIANDVDNYVAGGGTDTLRIAVTADEYSLINTKLTAYANWLAANKGSNATYSFNFATDASGGALSVNGFETLQIQIVNSKAINLAANANSNSGSLNSLNLFSNTIGTSSTNFTDTFKIVGVASGTVGSSATTLDPSITVAKYLDGTATLPTSYTVNGTDGTLTVNADGTYTYTVTSHTALTDTFTLTTLDQNGFVTSTTLTFGVPDQPPVVSGPVTGMATEDGVTSTLNALANASDADANTTLVVTDVPASLPAGVSYNAATHSFTLDPSNAAYQSLAQGQTITVSVTYNVSDGIIKTTASVSWTITGTNDAAIISGTTTGAVVEAGGVNNGTAGTPTATGTLTDTDVDNAANSFQAVAAPTAGDHNHGTYTVDASGHWSYALDNSNSAVQALNDGQQLTDTFTVKTADGTAQLVTITITGTNDAAVVSGDITGAVIEAGGVNNGTAGTPTATGTLTDTDVDNAANSFQAVAAPTAGDHNHGTYTVDASGHWSYALDNSNSAVQALNDGQQLTDTFTVKTADGTAQLVTITITGTNDAAVVSGDITGAVIEAGGVNNGTAGTPTATGTLTDTDVDNAANSFQAVAAPTAGDHNHGTYTVDASGHWSYALDNSNSAVQALNDGQQLTDTFTVKTADGTAQLVTITITGTNDAAVVSGDITGAVIEAGGVNNGTAGTPTATGTLTDTDVDNAANSFQAVAAPTAGDHNYGTYTVDASGHWSYALDNSNSAVQALNDGQQLTDTFTVKTADGTAQLVTITITGTNDAAVVSGDITGAVIEAGGVNNGTAGTPTATGTLTDTDVDNAANSFQAVAAPTAGDHNYGTYTVDASGHWSYALDNSNSAVQALNDGQQLTDTFTVKTADGTAQLVTITITGTNDAAVVSGDITGAVIEAGGVNNGTAGTPTATGTLTDTDVDNAANSFQAVAAPTAGDHNYGTYTVDASGHWSYALDNSNSAVQALNDGQQLTDTFTVKTADGTAQLVTITITGTNDAAVVSGDITGAVIEAGGVNNGTAGTPTATGTLTDTDVDNAANSFQAVAAPTAGDHNYGTYTVDASGHWSYALDNSNSAVQALNDGQQLTDTFTVKTADGTAQLVTITITGTNDAAVVSGDITGAVVEAGGVNNGTAGTPTATGTLTDTDVDNAANSFQAVAAPTAGDHNHGTYTVDASGHWSYALDNSNSAVQALNDGQQLTDTFTVKTADGTAQLVTITITGTNDAAVVSGDITGAVVEAGGVNNGTAGTPTATGTLTDTDVDNAANSFQAVAAPTAGDHNHGTYTVDASGHWSYALDNSNSAVQALNDGQQLTDTFTVKTADGTAQLVTITITGTNDAAVVSGDITGAVIEAGGVNNGTAGTPTATGTLTDTDVDNAANSFQAVAAPTAGDHNHGTYTVDASGHWSYALDNSNSAVQALNDGQQLTDTFTVKTADGTAQLVTITITGTNDAAVVSGDITGAVIEAGGVNNGTAGTPTATGTLTDTDVDNAANSFQAVAAPTAGDHNYGTYTVDASGHWSYALDNSNSAVQALNDGQQLTDTFTVKTADGTAQLVTITITGTNDAAVVSGDITGAVIEAGGVNNGTAGTPTATGTLTDTDVDNAANSFQAVAAPTAGDHNYGTYTVDASGHWSYALDNSNSAVQALNDGQQLTDTFTVKTADGTAQLVTITITGTNDAAVVSGDITGAVIEAGGVNNGTAGTPTATGTLTDTDVDNAANSFQAVAAPTAGDHNYGTYTVDASGHWSYALDNSNSAVQALNDGQQLTDTFTVKTADGTAQLVTITITGTNDAAVVNANGGSLSYTENQAATPIDIALTLSDVDSANLTGATVSITGNFASGEDVLGFTNQNGITGSYNEVTGVLTLSGTATVAQYQAALDSVTYFNSSDNPSGATRTISYQVDDGQSANHASNIVTSTVTVTPVNDAPTAAAPASYSATEQVAVSLKSASLLVSDVDGGSGSETLTLSVGEGTLTATAGNSGATVLGSGSSSLTISGTLAQINSFLGSGTASTSTLSYTDNTDTPSGSTTLSLSINDNGNTGTGGAKTGSASSTINITAVNDAPTAAAPASYSATEQVAVSLKSASLLVSDVDGGSGSETLTLSVGEGTLTATAGNSGATVLGSGSSSLTISGTLAQINSFLGSGTASTSTLSYTDNTDTPSGSTTLSLSINDNGNTGTGGAKTGSASSTINITAVNDAPTAAAPASYSATEQVAVSLKSASLLVSDVDGGSGSETLTLSVGEGTLTATAGNSGATVLGSGSSSLTISGTLAQINSFLGSGTASTSTLSYTDNTDTPSGSTTLSLSINDNGNTGTGGAKTGSASSTINITAVNDAPTAAAPASYSATEQVAVSLKSASLLVSDVDGGSGSETLTLSVGEGTLTATAGNSGATVLGSGSSSLTISGTLAQINSFLGSGTASTSTLSYTDNTDTPSASTTLSLSINDNGNTGTGGAKTGSASSTINITAVNDAPTAAAPASYSATEQVAVSLKSASLLVSDVDGGSGSETLTLSVGEGTLTATAGNSGATVLGSGSSSLTISGTLAQINSFLGSGTASTSTLSYTDNTDTPSGSTTLSLTINDNGNTGTGGSLTGSASSTINITAVNDAPVNTVPGLQSIGKNNSSVVFSTANGNAISISDADVNGGNGTHKETVTLSLSPVFGSLTLHQTTNLTFSTGDGTSDATMTFTGTIADINAALNGLTYNHPNGSDTTVTLTITTNDNGNSGSGGAQQDVDSVQIKIGSGPSGIAGEPINLGLPYPSDDHSATIDLTISNLPAGWTINEGTDLGNGSWLVKNGDIATLSVVAPRDFAGAQVFNVNETWTNADGSTGALALESNVEVYRSDNPIFALSGDDTLTASSGHDLFVFSQPIGNDIVHSFEVSSDVIDLISYGWQSFADVQAHTADDANGNAVITLTDGQTITLDGVHAADLSAANFEFDVTPTTENPGPMTIGDGAMLPLSGIIHNTGEIDLQASGDDTLLQLIQTGITLNGGGQVIMSDDDHNIIAGTAPNVTLDNVDNVISGAGQLGQGDLTLSNEGSIIATGVHALVLDTGSNVIANAGTLEATGAGGLVLGSGVANNGLIWANGGAVMAEGAVTGSGTALISGAGTIEFSADSTANTTFDVGASGHLILDDVFHFTGTVSGLGANDDIDLKGIGFSAGTTVNFTENQAGTGGTLTVSDGAQTASIVLLGQYDPTGFTEKADMTNGTVISYDPHHIA
ncbi:VCBS domain-containing protein [Bradyrhizobium sp. CB82]|nr:VCBS domain-containing protein [Bradyrhizobium sp. CB82]WFU38082.1 VCBS domain-containing protein [Bradyrhizobium sp. CB82]